MAETILKVGSSGPAVLELQKNLQKLINPLTKKPYFNATPGGNFGPLTSLAVRTFQAVRHIKVDGIVGPQTQGEIKLALQQQADEAAGIMQYGDTGEAVKKLQANLHTLIDPQTKLPYYNGVNEGSFLGITKAAVMAFQADNGLPVNGIADKATLAAIDKALAMTQAPQVVQYLTRETHPNLTSQQLTEINAALQGVNTMRRNMVIEGCKYVWPIGIYMIGANEFNKSLKLNTVDEAEIKAYIKRAPTYVTNGRGEFLLKHVREMTASGKFCVGTDCSGQEVGLLRFFKLVSPSFDTTANGMYHSYCHAISREQLMPGDFVFKKPAVGRIPHMAMYVGNGWVLEAAGGAYGVVLSQLDTHRVKNQMTGRTETHKLFNCFGRPKFAGYES